MSGVSLSSQNAGRCLTSFQIVFEVEIMPLFKRCPHCGNEEDRTSLYKCRDCGHVFCSGCKNISFIPGSYCPSCDSNSTAGHLGNIEIDDIEESDENDDS
jgi:hypothetical protein